MHVGKPANFPPLPHPFAVIIGFLGMTAKLSHICFSCLAQFSSSYSCSPPKIIFKQLSTLVNIFFAFRLLTGDSYQEETSSMS